MAMTGVIRSATRAWTSAKVASAMTSPIAVSIRLPLVTKSLKPFNMRFPSQSVWLHGGSPTRTAAGRTLSNLPGVATAAGELAPYSLPQEFIDFRDTIRQIAQERVAPRAAEID